MDPSTRRSRPSQGLPSALAPNVFLLFSPKFLFYFAYLYVVPSIHHPREYGVQTTNRLPILGPQSIPFTDHSAPLQQHGRLTDRCHVTCSSISLYKGTKEETIVAGGGNCCKASANHCSRYPIRPKCLITSTCHDIRHKQQPQPANR